MVWYSDVAVGLTPGGGKTVVTSPKHPDQVLGPLCVQFPGLYCYQFIRGDVTVASVLSVVVRLLFRTLVLG